MLKNKFLKSYLFIFFFVLIINTLIKKYNFINFSLLNKNFDFSIQICLLIVFFLLMCLLLIYFFFKLLLKYKNGYLIYKKFKIFNTNVYNKATRQKLQIKNNFFNFMFKKKECLLKGEKKKKDFTFLNNIFSNSFIDNINFSKFFLIFLKKDSYLVKKRRKKYYNLLLVHFLVLKLQKNEFFSSLNLNKNLGNYPFTLIYDEETINFRRSKYFDYTSTELFFLLLYGFLEWLLTFYVIHLSFCVFYDFNLFEISFKLFENFLPVQFHAYLGYIKISILLNVIFFLFLLLYTFTDWVLELTDEVSTYQLPPKDWFVDVFLPTLQAILLFVIYGLIFFLFFYNGYNIILIFFYPFLEYIYAFTLGFFISIENLILLIITFDYEIFIKLFLIDQPGLVSKFYSPFFSSNQAIYEKNFLFYSQNLVSNYELEKKNDFYFFSLEYQMFLELKIWKKELLLDLRKYNYFFEQDKDIFISKNFINQGFRGLGLRLDNQYFFQDIELITKNKIRHFRPNSESLIDPLLSNKFQTNFTKSGLDFENFSIIPVEKKLNSFFFESNLENFYNYTLINKINNYFKKIYIFLSNINLYNYEKKFYYTLDINDITNFKINSKYIYNDLFFSNLNYFQELNNIKKNNFVLQDCNFIPNVSIQHEEALLILNLNLLGLDYTKISSIDELKRYINTTLIVGDLFNNSKSSNRENLNKIKNDKNLFSQELYLRLKNLLKNENDLISLILFNIEFCKKYSYDNEIVILNNLLKNIKNSILDNNLLNLSFFKISINNDFFYPFFNVLFKPFYFTRNVDLIQLMPRISSTNSSTYYEFDEDNVRYWWDNYLLVKNRLFKFYANFPSVFSFFNRKNILYIYNLGEKIKYRNSFKNQIINENVGELLNYNFSSYYNMEIKIQNYYFFQNTILDRYFHKFFDATFITNKHEVFLDYFDNNLKKKLIFIPNQRQNISRFSQILYNIGWKNSKNIWLEYPYQDYVTPFIQYVNHTLNFPDTYKLEIDYSQSILDNEKKDLFKGYREPIFSSKIHKNSLSVDHGIFDKKIRNSGFIIDRDLLRTYQIGDLSGLYLIKDYQASLFFDKKSFFLNKYLSNIIIDKFIFLFYSDKYDNNYFNNYYHMDLKEKKKFIKSYTLLNFFFDDNTYTKIINELFFKNFVILNIDQNLILVNKNYNWLKKINIFSLKFIQDLNFEGLKLKNKFKNLNSFIFYRHNDENINKLMFFSKNYQNLLLKKNKSIFNVFVPFLNSKDVYFLRNVFSYFNLVPKQEELNGIFERINIRLTDFIDDRVYLKKKKVSFYYEKSNNYLCFLNLRNFVKLRGQDPWELYLLNKNNNIYDKLLVNIDFSFDKLPYEDLIQSSKKRLIRLQKLTNSITPYRLNYRLKGFNSLKKDISNFDFKTIISFYLDKKNFLNLDLKIINEDMQNNLINYIFQKYKKRLHKNLTDDFSYEIGILKPPGKRLKILKVDKRVFASPNTRHFLLKSHSFCDIFFKFKINPYLFEMFNFPFDNIYSSIWNKSLHNILLNNQVLNKIKSDKIFGKEIINNQFKYKKIYFLKSLWLLNKLDNNEELFFFNNFKFNFNKIFQVVKKDIFKNDIFFFNLLPLLNNSSVNYPILKNDYKEYLNDFFWYFVDFESEAFIEKKILKKGFYSEFIFLKKLHNVVPNILDIFYSDFGVPFFDWFVDDVWVSKRFRKYGFRLFKTYRTFYKKDERLPFVDFVKRAKIRNLENFEILEKPQVKRKKFLKKSFVYHDQKLLIYKFMPTIHPKRPKTSSLTYRWIFVTNKLKPIPLLLIFKNNQIRGSKIKTYLIFLQTLGNSYNNKSGLLFWSYFLDLYKNILIINQYLNFEKFINLPNIGKLFFSNISEKSLDRTFFFISDNFSLKFYEKLFLLNYFSNKKNNNLFYNQNILEFSNFFNNDFLVEKKLNQFKYLSRFLIFNERVNNKHLNFYSPEQYCIYRYNKWNYWLKLNKFRRIEDNYFQYNLSFDKTFLYYEKNLINIKEIEESNRFENNFIPFNSSSSGLQFKERHSLPYSLNNPKKYYVPYNHHHWYYTNLIATYPLNFKNLKFYSFYSDFYESIRRQSLKVLKIKIQFDFFQIQKIYHLRDLLYKYNYFDDKIYVKNLNTKYFNNIFEYYCYFYIKKNINFFYYYYLNFLKNLNNNNFFFEFKKKFPFIYLFFFIFFKFLSLLFFFFYNLICNYFVNFLIFFFQITFDEMIKFYRVFNKIYFHPFWIFTLYFFWVLYYFYLARFFTNSREHYDFKNLFAQFDWDEEIYDFDLARRKYDTKSFFEYMRPTHELFLKNVREFQEKDRKPTMDEIKKSNIISYTNEILKERHFYNQEKKNYWFSKRFSDYENTKNEPFERNITRQSNQFIYNYFVKPIPKFFANTTYVSKSNFLFNNNKNEKIILKNYTDNLLKDFVRHGFDSSEFGRFRWLYHGTILFLQFFFVIISSSFVFFLIF
jgi:hypothetical protein